MNFLNKIINRASAMFSEYNKIATILSNIENNNGVRLGKIDTLKTGNHPNITYTGELKVSPKLVCNETTYLNEKYGDSDHLIFQLFLWYTSRFMYGGRGLEVTIKSIEKLTKGSSIGFCKYVSKVGTLMYVVPKNLVGGEITFTMQDQRQKINNSHPQLIAFTKKVSFEMTEIEEGSCDIAFFSFSYDNRDYDIYDNYETGVRTRDFVEDFSMALFSNRNHLDYLKHQNIGLINFIGTPPKNSKKIDVIIQYKKIFYEDDEIGETFEIFSTLERGKEEDRDLIFLGDLKFQPINFRTLIRENEEHDIFENHISYYYAEAYIPMVLNGFKSRSDLKL